MQGYGNASGVSLSQMSVESIRARLEDLLVSFGIATGDHEQPQAAFDPVELLSRRPPATWLDGMALHIESLRSQCADFITELAGLLGEVGSGNPLASSTTDMLYSLLDDTRLDDLRFHAMHLPVYCEEIRALTIDSLTPDELAQLQAVVAELKVAAGGESKSPGMSPGLLESNACWGEVESFARVASELTAAIVSFVDGASQPRILALKCLSLMHALVLHAGVSLLAVDVAARRLLLKLPQ